MFGLQPWHLIAILVVALIFFGPQRMPEIARAIGQAIREFREAADGAQREAQKGIDPVQAANTVTPLMSSGSEIKDAPIATNTVAESQPRTEVEPQSELKS